MHLTAISPLFAISTFRMCFNGSIPIVGERPLSLIDIIAKLAAQPLSESKIFESGRNVNVVSFNSSRWTLCTPHSCLAGEDDLGQVSLDMRLHGLCYHILGATQVPLST